MTHVDQPWLPPTKDLLLTGYDVHVWRASLLPSGSLADHMARLLSVDEQDRAIRFHFEADRTRFIVGRGILRSILGDYLGVHPASIRFHYTSQGKPSLLAPEGNEGFCFNLSDSGDFALYAFALNRRIGIDLERIRTVPDMQEISQRFFAPEEYKELFSLPTSLQQEGFFRCWTRKEAYLKAIGEGLGFPLDQFVVSLDSKELARVVSILGDPVAASRWSLRELVLSSDYIAALVVEGQEWRLSCWDWAASQSY